MQVALARRLIAEAVGTALLIVFGPGSVVAAVKAGNGTVDYAGVGMIALAFGFVVALIIYAIGTTSGAHINPAVTVGLAAVKRFPVREVGPYILAQLVGAVVGGLLVVAVFGTTAAEQAGVGLTKLGTDVNPLQGLVAEVLATALLLITVMALAVDTRAPAGWAGFGIGLAVIVEILVIGPITGGSVNPARTFGPYVTQTLIGGDTPWSEFWLYVVGPLLGAVLGCFGYDLLARPTGDEPPAPVQGTEGDITGRREPVTRASGGRRQPARRR